MSQTIIDMKFSVRYFLPVFIFLLFLFCKTPALAQYSNDYSNPYTNPATNSDVPKNLHTLSQSLLIEIMAAIGCQIAGVDPTNPSQKCLGIDPISGKIGFVENGGGAIGIMGNAIAILYTPPTHTGEYFKFLAGNFGIAKETHAQRAGVGLTSLGPIASIWQVFRNIVYLLFVLVFAFIGLGIMFRVRVDPRTVMTIQNQIPKIIIGLILVTLSLAIAGFLIDLMWVITIVIINVLISADPALKEQIKPTTYVTPFSVSDVTGGFFAIAGNVAHVLGAGIYNTFNTNTIGSVIQLPGGAEQNTCGLNPICLLTTAIGGVIGGIINGALGILLGFIVGSFVFVIVIVAVLWALFRLWFTLLSAYISILFNIIFAPFWIVAGLLPNPDGSSRVGFGAWIRDLAGNLMAFPVTIAMFFMARIIMDGLNTYPKDFFQPPLVGSVQSSSFGSVIAFGIIMMLPNVVKMTKAAFRSSSFDSRSVEQGVGVGQAVALVGGKRFWGGMTRQAGMGFSAGPLRYGAAYLLSGRRNEASIHELANKATGRWYSPNGRFNRHRIAANILGKPQKPVTDSDVSGGASNPTR